MRRARKPRATKKRVEAAELYLNISGTCTMFAQGMGTDNPQLSKMVYDNRKKLALGKEFIQDLLVWEKDRLLVKEKK
jgi:hypothetical protein